ncbi:MAG: hypothetical protein PHP86_06305 [Nevskiales bacterium]|nr:hypothetical protein [Nevskiales bacterium]
MSLRMATVALVALIMSGCASNRHCVGVKEYQTARTLPPPVAVEGLSVPESASALQIPPAPEHPVPFAHEVADPESPGETQLECLDVPPRLPPEKLGEDVPKS